MKTSGPGKHRDFGARTGASGQMQRLWDFSARPNFRAGIKASITDEGFR